VDADALSLLLRDLSSREVSGGQNLLHGHAQFSFSSSNPSTNNLHLGDYEGETLPSIPFTHFPTIAGG
jgi:hypothetical protein